MTNKVLWRVTVAGLCALGGDLTQAGYMQCGQHLIQDGGRHGPYQYEVIKKCGNPAARHGNNWIYDDGERKKELHFNDGGLLESIQDLN